LSTANARAEATRRRLVLMPCTAFTYQARHDVFRNPDSRGALADPGYRVLAARLDTGFGNSGVAGID